MDFGSKTGSQTKFLSFFASDRGEGVGRLANHGYGGSQMKGFGEDRAIVRSMYGVGCPEVFFPGLPLKWNSSCNMEMMPNEERLSLVHRHGVPPFLFPPRFMCWCVGCVFHSQKEPPMVRKIKDSIQSVPGCTKAVQEEPRGEADYRIYILLTRYTDTLSKAVSGFSRGYYSHASIGFEPSFDTFFSFTMKGFRIETPARICKRKKKEIPCTLYSLPVPEGIYRFMYDHVDNYRVNSGKWKFNLIGLACGMIHLPFFRREHHRFCSQFVAEVLELDTTIRFKKRSSIMLPKDFLKVPELNLEFKGTLTGLAALGFAPQAS